MRKIVSYGPALLVVIVGGVTLTVGPRVLRTFEHARQIELVREARMQLDDEVDVLQRINDAHRHIAAIVEPSVVFVSVQGVTSDGEQIAATGSGWVYDDHGDIVTNYHVIESAKRIQVQFSTGWVSDARIVGKDELTDVAVLKVDNGPVISARRAVGKHVRQGDQVFAFGSPFNFKGSMSKGIVSGTGRTTNSRDSKYQNYIQTDAAINRGNSGGPLVDVHGEVVGMNTAIATIRDGASTGVGFAIPLATVDSVVEQIITSGEVARTVMGVNLMDISQLEQVREAQKMGFHGRGVLAAYVFPGYPAAEAGLRDGDIITRVDGEPMSSIDVLRSTITGHRPGDIINMRIWRKNENEPGGRTIDLKVRLTQVETDDRGLPNIVNRRLGDSDTQAAVRTSLSHYGILQMENYAASDESVRINDDNSGNTVSGVRVLEVRPVSAAETDGLKQDTIITAVNNVPISSERELLNAIWMNAFEDDGSPSPVILSLKTPQGDQFDTEINLDLEKR